MITHILEYYSALKKKEVLTPPTLWPNLEDMMLSERSQTQKDRHTHTDSTHRRSLEESDPETASRWWGQGGGRERELVFHGDRASIWEDEKVLEMMGGWLHNSVNMLNAIKLCT